MDTTSDIKIKGTVMVVDDEAEIVKVTCLQLNTGNYATLGCGSPLEALEALRGQG
jgi:CheY-like chemotaxis protein